jgi:hypothetical protein
MTTSDAQFVQDFEGFRVPGGDFRHPDHVRIAWWYLQGCEVRQAVEVTQLAIRRFAEHHGHPAKFHWTLTELWVRLVAAHVAWHPADTFGDFIVENGKLLDKNLPLRFYSHERLYSQEARSKWIEPDIKKLPTP